MAFFVGGTIGYLFHVWSDVSVGLFFLVISICTVFLFWEGNWNNWQLNNCFWKIWSKTRPDWMVTEEAVAAVEAVLKW